MNILVTGGNGQLATCIKSLDSIYKDYNFIYVSSENLDITKANDVNIFFETNTISYCVNCAAYTAVDKAENEVAQAEAVNVIGSENLAKACKKYNVKLIHVSTDFVFDGTKNKPYSELDITNPIGVYGSTKRDGEIKIENTLENYFIIRTSWLYSEYANNFLKTMLRLASNRDELGVVADQIGTPTYAVDLANTIIKIITTQNKDYGIYHYSNEGVASWYDFAAAIFDIKKLSIKLNPIKTEAFPTPAKRPNFSVLDKEKIKTKLNIEIPHWRESLKKAISSL